jgi:hypothetical protein
VQYNKALSTILDRAGKFPMVFKWLFLIRWVLQQLDTEDNVRDEVLTAAKLLYGLIHARYIITIAGLGVMVIYVHKNYSFSHWLCNHLH